MPNLPEGTSAIRLVSSAAPGAGFDVALTVPPRARWLLKTARVQIITAVAVANRETNLVISRSGTDIYVVPSQLIVTASQVFTFYWMSGWTLQPYTDSAFQRALALPPGILLLAGDVVTTDTANLAAADQLSSLAIAIDEWIEP